MNIKVTGHKTADPALYAVLQEKALQMRQHPTDGERAMWTLLQDKAFGVRFRRQHVIEDYIVDFVAIKPKLIIEVDGEYHVTPEQQAQDLLREKALQKMGFRIVRFTNEQVFNSPDLIKKTIQAELS